MNKRCVIYSGTAMSLSVFIALLAGQTDISAGQFAICIQQSGSVLTVDHEVIRWSALGPTSNYFRMNIFYDCFRYITDILDDEQLSRTLKQPHNLVTVLTAVSNRHFRLLEPVALQ